MKPDRVAKAFQALLNEWRRPVMLRDILEMAGAEIAEDPEDADIDLSLENLAKDTLISLLTGEV